MVSASDSNAFQTRPNGPSKISSANPEPAIWPAHFPKLPADWTSEAEVFQWDEDVPTSDRNRFFMVTDQKQGTQSPRALLVIHGMGEHGGRYLHVPHYVQSVVDTVFRFDLRGHGRSEGLRGDVERFDLLVEDVRQAILRCDQKLKAQFGTSELHLLGHSLGGHLVLRALLLYPDLPIKTLNISAPFLAVKAKVPAAKKFAAKILAKTWGTLQLGTGLDAAAISHDVEVVKAYQNDRLVHDKMTPRFYQSLVAAMQDTLTRETGLSVPVQFLIPMADAICDQDVTLEFFKRLKVRDKRLKTYANLFHEPLNELEKDAVFADLVQMIGTTR